MSATLKYNEIERLIQGKHHDPFSILGAHPFPYANNGYAVIARAFLPGAHAVTILDLDQEKEHSVWLHMKNVLHSKDEQLILKMFIGDNEIPFLSVYSMGYRIMQEFIENNPEVSLLEWTDLIVLNGIF